MKNDAQSLIGKTYLEVIEILGNNYDISSNEEILIYQIRKTWFCKGSTLVVEFNEKGIVNTVYTVSNDEFKK